jgi:hypothetical protein
MNHVDKKIITVKYINELNGKFSIKVSVQKLVILEESCTSYWFFKQWRFLGRAHDFKF